MRDNDENAVRIRTILESGPRTADEFPPKLQHTLDDVMYVFSVKCSGFKTVYYLFGDEEAAIGMFIQVNLDLIQSLDFDHETELDSGLQKWQVKAIKKMMTTEIEEEV